MRANTREGGGGLRDTDPSRQVTHIRVATWAQVYRRLLSPAGPDRLAELVRAAERRTWRLLPAIRVACEVEVALERVRMRRFPLSLSLTHAHKHTHLHTLHKTRTYAPSYVSIRICSLLFPLRSASSACPQHACSEVIIRSGHSMGLSVHAGSVTDPIRQTNGRVPAQTHRGPRPASSESGGSNRRTG